MSARRCPTHIRQLSIAVAAAILAIALAAQVAQAGVSPLRYVALGDSYSAASGVLPLDLSAPQCLRSVRNYPHVIASASGAQLKDVTCGAAETSDFFESQYPGVAPQLDAVKAAIELDDSGLAARRPANAFVNTLPIKRTAFGVRIHALDQLNGVFKKTDAPVYMKLPDSRAGAMSCLTGIAIRNSIDQKRPIKIADLVKL